MSTGIVPSQGLHSVRSRLPDIPAPVITAGGTYGRLPPSPNPDFSRFEHRSSNLRSKATWFIGFLLIVFTTLWMATLSSSQATNPEIALPAQERGTDILFNVDELLEFRAEEIASAEPSATGGVKVPGFLVQGVELTIQEAQHGDREEMRSALLRRSARMLYEHGLEPLRPHDDPQVDTVVFSTPGGARNVIELMSSSNHKNAKRFLQPTSWLVIILSTALLFLGQGFSRFIGMAVAMMVSGALILLATLLLMFTIAFIGSDGTFVANEFSKILKEVAWVPGRNGIVLLAAGLVILVPALLINWFFNRPLVHTKPVTDQPDNFND